MLMRALFKHPSRDASADLSSATYLLPGIDLTHVRRYNAAFGFAGDAVPLTYLYLIAQRAQLATMLDRPTPFKIPGLIHVENSLAMHGFVDPGRPLAITTRVAMQPPAPNGALHCLLETQAFDGSRLVFACSSDYLLKRGSKSGGMPHATLPSGKLLGQWSLSPVAGRRYAALSGDWNPIHLWSWTARLMGLRTPIIHGAHTMAKACALLQQAAGRPVGSLWCRFRSPVPLGGEVTLVQGEATGECAAICNRRVAMEGRAGFA